MYQLVITDVYRSVITDVYQLVITDVYRSVITDALQFTEWLISNLIHSLSAVLDFEHATLIIKRIGYETSPNSRTIHYASGHAVVQLVEALRRFDSRRCHWNLSLNECFLSH